MTNAAVKPHVLTALKQVRGAINAIGIAKDREARGDGISFRFRGIDLVLDSFSGPMDKAGLIALPSYRDLSVMERKTRNGGTTYNVRCECSITFTSLEDGSEKVAGPFFGEANDTQDKASAKAQSIAYRTGMLLSFCVPLGADADPESTEHDGDERPPRDDGPPRHDAENPARSARAAEGKISDPLGDSRKRILEQNCKRSGYTLAELEAVIGKVDTSNYNAAIDWLRDNKR